MKERWKFALLLLTCVTSLMLWSGNLRADDDDEDRPKPPDRTKLIAIARLFVPADIAAQSNRDPHTMPLSVDAISGNLDGNSTMHVVAVYANGVNARVRVLRIDASGPRLLTELSVLGMAGLIAHVDLQDIDGDKKPEVILTFGGGGGRSGVWVLKWNGTQLSSITPVIMTSGLPVSALMDAVFEDIDGSGKLWAVPGGDPGGDLGDQSRSGVMRSRTYRLTNGQFVPGPEFFYERRVWGFESPLTNTFVLGRLDVPYRIRVSNGDASGNNRVNNGEIIVNDATLVSKGDFDHGSRVLTATFQPRRTNILQVNIQGSKKDTLFIAVEPVSPIVDFHVSPVIECVWADGDGRFTASFGYNNPNPWYIALDLGARNAFSGERINRGQSEVFFPGRHSAVFWVQSNGEPLAWTLDGTTATATLDIPRCTASEPVARGF